jgi:hypothetical protein
MRYDLRRDPRTAHVPYLVGSAIALPFVLALVIEGFSIWLLLLGFAGTLFVYVSWEATFRMGSYLILHKGHLDVRQLGWGQEAIPERARIPYSHILRLRVLNDTEVELVYARQRLTGDPARDMEALVFKPINPHAVAVNLQGRVEHALATSQS